MLNVYSLEGKQLTPERFKGFIRICSSDLCLLNSHIGIFEVEGQGLHENLKMGLREDRPGLGWERQQFRKTTPRITTLTKNNIHGGHVTS